MCNSFSKLEDVWKNTSFRERFQNFGDIDGKELVCIPQKHPECEKFLSYVSKQDIKECDLKTSGPCTVNSTIGKYSGPCKYRYLNHPKLTEGGHILEYTSNKDYECLHRHNGSPKQSYVLRNGKLVYDKIENQDLLFSKFSSFSESF